MDLSNKVALVTGGASGIGAAACRLLAGSGAQVAVVDLDEVRAKAVADEVGGLAVPGDVSAPDAMNAIVATVEQRFGRLDVVLLNAGISAGQRGVEDLDLERYRRIMAVNVDHVVFGLNAVVPALRRAGGGTVVATASLAGLVPAPGDSIYTLTKHAVVGYVRAAAPLLADDGIRVNAVCPGFADTPLIAAARDRFTGRGSRCSAPRTWRTPSSRSWSAASRASAGTSSPAASPPHTASAACRGPADTSGRRPAASENV